MKYLFDSNILIYHLRGSLNQRGSDLILEGLTGEGAYSIILKIELLGFKQPLTEEQQARLFLSGLQELELTSEDRRTDNSTMNSAIATPNPVPATSWAGSPRTCASMTNDLAQEPESHHT